MRLDLTALWEGMIAHWRRQAFVDRLQSLTDRQLDDIGLRRDQLDALRLPPPAPRPSPRAPARLARPSLQGCG